MPTLVEKSIGTGGDYTTIAAFITAAATAQVVTNDLIWRGKLKNQTFTESPNFAGLQGDATRYVELTVEAAADWRPAARTGPLRYNASERAAIFGTIAITSPRVRLTGLQVRYGTWAATMLYMNSSATSVTIRDCLFEGYLAQYIGYLESASGTHTFDNIVGIQDWNGGGNGFMFRNAGTYNMNQVTLVRPNNNSTAGTAYWADWSYPVLKNCAGFGYSVFNNGWATGNNNASSTTISFGTGNQASLTYADQFKNPNAGSGTHDFRLETGSALIGNGANLSGIVDTDITTTTRSTPYDIGAWAVGATTVTYNDVFSDSATASESYTVALTANPALSGSATGSESFTVALTTGAMFTDTAVASDSLIGALVMSYSLSDPALALDVFAVLAVMDAALTQQATATENMAAQSLMGVVFSDSVNPTDRFSTAVYVSSAFTVICAQAGYPLFSLDPAQAAHVEEARHVMFVVTEVQATSGGELPGLALTISEVPAAVIELAVVKNSRC